MIEPEKVKSDFAQSAISPEIHNWDDPYWQERTPIALIVHALAQKQGDVGKHNLAKRKEIISDSLPAIAGVYTENVALLTFTALAGVIIYGLHAEAKTSEQEYFELLKIWAEYKNNCNAPDTERTREQKRKHAEKIVETRIAEMNIKLTDISISDTEQLKLAMAQAEKDARKRKLIPPKKVQAKDVEQMGGRLQKIAGKHGKAIADNFIAPILDTAHLYSEAFKSCLHDLKSPSQAFNGIMDGAKAGKDKLLGLKESKARKAKRETYKGKLQFVRRKTTSLPESTTIKTDIDLEIAKRYSDTIKNIEDYNPKQARALRSYVFASGLAGIGVVSLGMISASDAITVSNDLQTTVIGIVAGAWGLAFGIGSWGDTGEVSKHYDTALNSSRALEAEEHKALAKAYDVLVETGKLSKNEVKNYSILPINWWSDRADLDVRFKDEDHTPS